MDDRKSQQVLILENVRDRYKVLAAALRRVGYTVESLQSAGVEPLENRLGESKPGLVLYGRGENMPSLESVTTLLAQERFKIPVIVITTKLNKRSMASAEKCGAAGIVQNRQTQQLLQMVHKELGPGPGPESASESASESAAVSTSESVPEPAAESVAESARDSGSLEQRVGQLEQKLELIELQHRVSELENTLKEKNARCEALTENSRDAIAYIHEGNHIFANRAYCNLFGYENDDEITGTPLLNWIDLHHNELLARLLRNPYASNEITKLRVKLTREDATLTEAELEFSVIRHNNRYCTQIMVRANAEQALSISAPDTLKHHDMVTGLYNRQYFMKLLEENITTTAKSGKFQAVTFILIDNFKNIREMIGITASDELISDVAGMIREIYGHENTLARFGDYTFTVLNNYSYKEGAQQLAETLRAKMERHSLVVDDQTIETTCSIGICVINDHVKNAQNAHSRADLACELARTSGGNQIHVHSTTIDAQIDREVEDKMDDMVRKTIDDDRFYLVYQPVISLNGKSGGHYEVLLRVLDEEGHVILPGQFLSLAEKSPLIMEIDRRVIQMAFKTLSTKHRDDQNIGFFIKISGETIADPKLPDWIDLQLKRFNLAGESIIFEIAESVAANKPHETQAFARAVRAIDCKVAIEHFGYANNPEIIKYLSVDFLKIDGSLINNLASSQDNQEKVKAIVELARRNDTLCIAEHVDDAHCLVMLWQYSIDYIQGNLVQEPMKELAHDFEAEAALAGIIETDEK